MHRNETDHDELLLLRNILRAVEEDREAGREGCTVHELEHYIDSILDNEAG